MSDTNIVFTSDRLEARNITGVHADNTTLDDLKIYEIQENDKVLGGKYWDPEVQSEYENFYDPNNVPVINEQAYELGLRDIFLDKKFDTKTDNLQEQINNITMKSDVVDVVNTKSSLNSYDVETLFPKDVLKVLQDETQQYKCTYYRFDVSESTVPLVAVFNTYADMSSSGLSADDFVEVLADETHLDADNEPLTTFYKWNGNSFEYIGCWKLIGSERTTLPLVITTNRTITPADNMFYILSGINPITVEVVSGTGTPYYAGLEITFLATNDATIIYNRVDLNTYSSLNIKTGQTFTLIYGSGGWLARNSTSLNSYINQPYKTYKNPGTFVYFYDGTAITSTYDIPSDKCSVVVIWENANTANAIMIDNATGKIYTKYLTAGTWGNNILADNIVWATYGTTTYSEVSALLTAGKSVMCSYNGAVYTLTETSANEYKFSAIYALDEIKILTLTSSDVWSSSSVNVASIDTIQTFTNKTISKNLNKVLEEASLKSDDYTLSVADLQRDLRFYFTATSSKTFVLPNFTTSDLATIANFAGITKTITANNYDYTIRFYGLDGNYQDTSLKAGETGKFKSYYDYTNNRLYWKKDVSDPDPVIVITSGNTGEIIYDNSNQIVNASGVVLTLGPGDKQGREVSITFLYDGTLVYTDQDNITTSDAVSAYTVSKFKWTGVGWIYETQKVGFSAITELPLIPRLTANNDQGFDLVASSEITGKEAYHAFDDHAILYNIGSTINFDDESFATNNDGNNGYLEVIHNAIVSRYRYLHIIDRGSADNSDPYTVAYDGITEYTISGTQDGGLTWTVLTTFTKTAEETDVNIALDTADAYNGFKIATTATSGTTRNVGFRKVQMYIPTKTTIREITEDSNDISAYCPLVPLMTSNNEKGFSLTQSSTKTGYEAFHAFNQHAITYYIGANGIVSLESSATDGDGNTSWLACNHSGFKVSYGYLHLVDRGTAGADPEDVADNGITQYTIYGFRNSAWELITTYSKSAAEVDVKIPLNTATEYYGFKIATTGTVGTTNEIGWRHIQMYVANKQEIQYVSEVDPNPVIISESVHTGLCTYYNKVFAVDTAGQTLTIDSADKIGREITIIPNASTTIAFSDKSGTAETLTLAQNQLAYLIWNGTGWIFSVPRNKQRRNNV